MQLDVSENLVRHYTRMELLESYLLHKFVIGDKQNHNLLQIIKKKLDKYKFSI